MNHKLLVGCLAFAAMESWLLPAESRACTCSTSPISGSAYPKDGAEDVPLNAALQVMGNFSADSLLLEDAAGAPVEFELYAGPTPSCPGTSAELVPKQALRPNTKYTVRVTPLHPTEAPSSLTFTTGTELLPDEEPRVPHGIASVVFDVPQDGQSCGSGHVYACLEAEPFRDVEVLALRGDQVQMRWMLLASGGAFKLTEQPDCIELRQRTATGRRSAPLKICGDELRPRPYRKSDRDSLGTFQCGGGIAGQRNEAVDEASASASTANADAGAPRLAVDAGMPIEPVRTEATAASGPSPGARSNEGECSVTFAAPESPIRGLSAASALLFTLAWRRRRRT